jgi:ABC-type Na+ efflux pump permease subunit
MNRKTGRFSHIGSIFKFTFRQGATGKAFVFMTIILPVLLFLACFLAHVIPASMQDETSDAEKVYIIDQTGTQMVGDVFNQLLDRDAFPELSVETVYGSDAETVLGAIPEDETKSFVILVEQDVDEEEIPFFRVTAIIPEWSEVAEEDYNALLELAGSCMDSVKVATAGIDYERLVYLSSSVYSDVVSAGEQPDTFGSLMVKTVAPMIISLILYMMILLYGQSIGKVVVAEKNSKLMEMMLTSVQPDALIAGKVMAMTLLALMQMALWILSIAAGCFCGNWAAKTIDPEFDNVVLTVIKTVMEEGKGAFSPVSIVLAVLALVFGFALYCILAGLVAAFAGKAEELASSMGIYNICVIAGFFAAYFSAMADNDVVGRAARIIPFSSAFILCADALVGNAGTLEAVLELLILVCTDALLVYITGKVYKARVFYGGTNPILDKLKLFANKR